jgi:SAM-dependent methyltransferase
MAESFGVDAERYDRARPSYPDALVARIVAASPGPDVLDVGCGTGIAARQFQAAGATVLGVDPDERMAEFARRTGVAVEVSTFEAWDPAGRRFDAVVAGQSWHWVDPVAGATKAAQVLRPAGLLAIFSHAYQFPPAVAEALAAAYKRVAPDSPIATKSPSVDVYQTGFARTADTIRAVKRVGEAGGTFGDPEQHRFDWEQTCTREELLELLPTTGGLTQLPPDKRAEVLAGASTAIHALGDTFTMPYTTLAVTAARTRSA